MDEQCRNKGKGRKCLARLVSAKYLKQFSSYCSRDQSRKQIYTQHVEKLRNALYSEAWDGDWFKRAYFDNGTPLGSSVNSECRIDSIAQSWCVIAGEGDSHEASRALASVDEYRSGVAMASCCFLRPHLIKCSRAGLHKRICAGRSRKWGQYTHAAIWTMIAFACW